MGTMADLPDEPSVLKAMLVALAQRNDRLERLVKELKRALFGRKSERLHPDQLALVFEDIESAIAAVEAEADSRPVTAAARNRTQSVTRGALPKHLPRVETVIEPNSTTCTCGHALHVIGEDVSERLDIVPAQFRVLVTRRPKYACRACETGIMQAPAPTRLIEGGLPTEAAIAHVLVGKYADHLPLYRQAQIYGRQGVELDRSTLAHWVGCAAFALRPVFEHLVFDLKRSTKLFMDETRAPVLDPGRGRTKTGYLWALARDDRSWSSTDPSAVAYFYAPGRGGAHAAHFLSGFSGLLQVDGYAGYNRLTKTSGTNGTVQLAYCWAHARRRLYDIAQAGDAPIAVEGLNRIAKFYQIEVDLRGRNRDHRQAERQARTKPLLEAFGAWLEMQRARLSPKSRLGEALSYIAKHWDGLMLFVDDGRIEIDNNIVERTIRPIALNRKNALFAGHDEGGKNWGIVASLIETAKLNDVDPFAYLTNTLEVIAGGHKQNQIDQLMPWNFKPNVNV